MRPTVVVLAKAPVPGRVKTRLTPHYSPEQAAQLAAASLADTLSAAAQVAGVRVVLALDGVLPGFAGEVVPQRGEGLDQRIAHAFDDCAGAPTVLVGMDTPQVTAAVIEAALDLLGRNDAVLGHADDGGWWALGLHRPDASLFLGVPMSTADTGRLQEERLRSKGLSVGLLQVLTDVDTPADADLVAALAPDTTFAAVLAGCAMARVA